MRTLTIALLAGVGTLAAASSAKAADLYRTSEYTSPDLVQHIFEGSVGGTPANRMIHKESQQLLIGPYLINAEKPFLFNYDRWHNKKYGPIRTYKY